MKKTPSKRRNDDLRPEYDLSQLKGGVRGKYYQQAIAGTNLVLIEPELADVFPDSESVNRALRLLADTAEAAATRAHRGGRMPNKRLKRTA
jgi:transposase-like protein